MQQFMASEEVCKVHSEIFNNPRRRDVFLSALIGLPPPNGRGGSLDLLERRGNLLLRRLQCRDPRLEDLRGEGRTKLKEVTWYLHEHRL